MKLSKHLWTFVGKERMTNPLRKFAWEARPSTVLAFRRHSFPRRGIHWELAAYIAASVVRPNVDITF